MESTSLILAETAFPHHVRTFSMPDGVDRAFRASGDAVVEISSTAGLVAVHASYFMVVPVVALGDIKQAAYYQKTKVPEIVDDARFLGSCEILKYGSNREIVFRAITKEFVGDVNKKAKPERTDIVHCWPVNDATLAKIGENYAAGVYTGYDISIADKQFFDAFFALDDTKKRLKLDIDNDRHEVIVAGYFISLAFQRLEKATLGKHLGEVAKVARKVEALEAENEHLRKKAKYIDSVTLNRSGEVSLQLNIKKACGDEGQMDVKGWPME